MKIVHLGLIALVCFGLAAAEMAPVSHMVEDLDLSWLPTPLVERVTRGDLKIVQEESEAAIEKFTSPVKDNILHIWKDDNNSWQYKEVHYDGPTPGDYDGMEGKAVAALEGSLAELEVTIPSQHPVIEESVERAKVEISLSEVNAAAEETVSEPSVSIPTIELTYEETPIETTVQSSFTNSVTESSTHTDGEEPVTVIKDGKVVTFYRKPKPDDGSPYIFIEIDDLWPGEVHTSNEATDLALKFSEVHGNELSLDEYTVLNNLVTTPDKNYWSQYNYWRVRRDQIEKALSTITVTYNSKISNRDVKYFANLIRECKDGYVSAVLNTSSLDINTSESWEIHAEMLVATCSEDNDKIQLFGWSGSKRGSYVPGAYSESNAKTLTGLVTRWLFAHAGLLVQCTKSPIEEMGIWSHPKIILRTSTSGHSQAIPVHAELFSGFD